MNHIIDKLLVLFIFIFTWPILIIIIVTIFLIDGFPIIYKQKRVGKDNAYFWIYKFRTMKNKTPDIPTHLLSNRNNSYTKSGPFFRKYSLDELPQLINIIKGDITFIGPRPALHNQEDLINMRTEKGIQKLTPGITGWAQVNGRDELEISRKVEMDYYYLINKSFWLDLKIIWYTIVKLFTAEGVKI